MTFPLLAMCVFISNKTKSYVGKQLTLTSLTISQKQTEPATKEVAPKAKPTPRRKGKK